MPGGQVARWSGDQVVRWPGGHVARWPGGQMVRCSGPKSTDTAIAKYCTLKKKTWFGLPYHTTPTIPYHSILYHTIPYPTLPYPPHPPPASPSLPAGGWAAATGRWAGVRGASTTSPPGSRSPGGGQQHQHRQWQRYFHCHPRLRHYDHCILQHHLLCVIVDTVQHRGALCAVL